MLFTACFVSYTMRVNMSINIIAMVEPATSNGNISVPECTLINQKANKSIDNATQEKLVSAPDYGERYEWDTKLQGLILGSYFWGYIITSIPGGFFAEKFGPTRTVMISTLIAGALTLLGPLASSWHYIALIISRFLTGLCGGLPPYKDIFLSVPFWALIFLHFGNLWGLFFLMTAGPNFLSTVLGFNLGHTGILASLPHLARLIFGLIFGLIGDFIRTRKLVSTTIVRKGFILFSHIIPGALLLLLNLTGCDVTWSVVLLTMSLGSNGASTLTNLQNSQDLAPNFAGTLYGVANCIGSTTGFITPLIVGELTSENNGLYEWHIIFCIGATVYIVSGLVFCVFGSAELQPWNEIKEKAEKDGVQNPAFDNTSEITVKVGDSTENTKV
ncbi:sialin [Asbolus verrucosus]|uniref:Sialin n=1 Tax=Asbolus verrucosus TaxID=1661398 RepID=A0A482WEN1_ASBVE|nr:sialin [Asbolus verrucosus]